MPANRAARLAQADSGLRLPAPTLEGELAVEHRLVIHRQHSGTEDQVQVMAAFGAAPQAQVQLSLIHISEPTRLRRISYAVFCLKKKRYR